MYLLREKWCLKALIVLVAISICSPGFAQDAKQSGQDRVAMVNGVVIPRTDFDRQMAMVQEQIRRSGKSPSGEELAAIRKGVLDQLIGRELIYQESQKKGFKVDQEAVTKQFDGLKGRFPSDEEFKNALSRANITEATVKSQIQRELAVNEFIEQNFIQKITVSDKEIKTYYDNHPDTFKQPEQVRASHILIKVEPQADEAQKAKARKKIDMIQGKLRKGEDFGALAKEYSEGPSSSRGGDLGSFSRGQMVRPFEDAAFAMKPGEVSGIVETQFGYHLIKVEEKKPETMVAYAEAKESIGEYLKNVEAQKEIALYVENLRKNAKVEIYLK